MYYLFAKILTLFLTIHALPAFAASISTAANAYDISYVWSKDAAAVQKYRDRVAQILGPTAARKLRVVVDGGRHGVIYLRLGDRAGTARVAKAHSQLLKKQGLGAAAPIVSKDWGVSVVDSVPTSTNSRVVSALATQTPVVVAEGAKPATKISRVVGDLEAAVENYIKQLRSKGRLSRDERTGWSVYDFTTGEKLVTINEDTQFQAASLIKPFIAAAFFHKVKKKQLVYGPRSRRHMKLMIHRSNNPSTNWVMRQVGGPRAVQRILKQNYPGIFRNTSIVEYIPRGGRTYRNKASARDYSRFLYALWKGNIAGAKEIKRLMSIPGPDRIYTGAESVPAGTKVLNKTGSTARLCADMGILNVSGPDSKRYPYTLIGIIEKRNKARNYTKWIRSRSEVIRDVSDIVYRGIAKRHEFANEL